MTDTGTDDHDQTMADTETTADPGFAGDDQAAGDPVPGDREITAEPDPGGAIPDGPAADGAGFAGLGLRPELVDTLAALGYEEPTPIQREAVPPLLDGHDLLGQAATGTGKTAAFALPVLQRLGERGDRPPQPLALVLVPTRELAMQVCEAMHRYGRQLGARVLPLYGGQPIGRQLQSLERGVDVVVATPGRALDHLRRASLDLDGLEVVILDEADEMLDMGFAEDIEAILDQTPRERQTVLFSATLPGRIDAMARQHLRQPVRVEIARETTEPGEAPRVRQVAYVVSRNHKPAALGRVLDVEAPTAALVFCRTRTEVDQLTETLNGRGYRAEALHGGMSQEQRERVMGRLRAGTAELLVATDVAARGLDVDVLTHVVNYDVPSAPETYVHRIGRVGRAGREGVAITLAEPRQHRLLKALERVTGQRLPVEKLPTVADLHARRLQTTVATLRARIAAGDLERFGAVVDDLAEDFDLMEIALGAIAAAADAAGPTDEQEIPEPASSPRRDTRNRGDDRRSRGDDGRRRGDDGPRSRPREGSGPAGETTRLYISVGRNAGIRPQDLVGAITGESSLPGRAIGTIEITDRFSLVEVPADAADRVVDALRGSTIKGRRATVRRERFERRGER